MNKGYLIEAVAKRLNSTDVLAKEVVDAVLDEIARALVRREDVAITGFGTFTVVDQAARRARNPQTGESLQVPATVRVKFRPGVRLTDHVRGLLTAAKDGKVVGKAPRARKAAQ